MSELLPPGGSEGYEACDDEGRGILDAPYLPLWEGGTAEGCDG